MPVFYATFHKLRHLVWYYRLFIVLSSFAILEVPVAYLIATGANRNVASILFFSGILAALLFEWKRAFPVQCVLLSSHVGILICIKGWGYPSITTIISATIVNFFIIWTIGCLRHGWEMAEENVEKQKELTALKDQFVKNVSHELRTPLTIIDGSVSVVRDNWFKLSNEEREMFLNEAAFGCTELQRLAENILDCAKYESDVPRPWPREIDLGKVIINELHHTDSSSHPIIRDIPTEEVIAYADSQHISQVVRNLLSNAFKYSPRGLPVTIRVWQDDTYSYTCIKDRGPGIRPDDVPKLFKKLSRLERDVASSIRGIGLGLYISQRLVEGMGGQIHVESAGIPGEGTSFIFTLPCVPQTTHKMRVVHKRERRKE